MSITEQQTGPLEMKGSEWSQSKTGPAGARYPTDSGGLGLGPRRVNDPSSWIRSIYTHTHSRDYSLLYWPGVFSCVFLSDKSRLFTH